MTEEQLAKHKEIYDAMIEAKAFDVSNGEVVLLFNHLGDLMDIRINTVAYRRRRAVDRI